MPATIKKSTPRNAKRLPAAKPPTGAKSKQRVKLDLAEDVAQREKVAQTLDLAAFMTHHRKNGASSKYWQERE